jgi:hypothetical protein
MKRTKKARKPPAPGTPARDKLVRQIAEAHLAPVRGGYAEHAPCGGCAVRCSGCHDEP